MKDATLKKFMGSSTKKILQDIKKVYHFQGKIEDIREERRYHYFRSLGRKNILFSGVEKLLKDLKRDYKLAIATGSSRVTVRYSLNKHFLNFFDSIVTVNDVKNGKPAPDQLFFVSKKLKVKPSNCLMVGDSLYDIIAAKNAGMDCVGVLTGYTSKEELLGVGANKVLKSVKEIKKFL